MSQSVKNPPNSEFAAAFALAKEALGYVGRFQTPPTPKVYEVWYRYVEGKSEAIRQQLEHAINESQPVDQEFLEQLYDQFCCANDPVSDRVGSELSHELEEFGSLIHSQLDAGEEFNSTINSANDTLQKGVQSSEEIKQCIAQLLESNHNMQAQLQNTRQRLTESQNQVKNLQRDLDASQRKMLTDPLTGAGNRRYFDNLMEQTQTKAARAKDASFLLLIDLDEFKEINDTFGHSVGDEVLKFVASQCRRLRDDAKIARYGGDEFAVFLDVADIEEATQFADDVRKACVTNKLKLAHSGELLGRIGISIGVARLRPDDTGESWFNRADQLLYRAKNSGRNCVMMERLLDSQ